MSDDELSLSALEDSSPEVRGEGFFSSRSDFRGDVRFFSGVACTTSGHMILTSFRGVSFLETSFLGVSFFRSFGVNFLGVFGNSFRGVYFLGVFGASFLGVFGGSFFGVWLPSLYFLEELLSGD